MRNYDKTDFSSIQYSLEHDLVWNEKDDSGNTLSPGVYLLTLEAGDISETTKVVAMD